MDKSEIINMENFEFTPKGFQELKAILKTGKAVRNPFAKHYSEEVEVSIIKTDSDESA